MFDVGVLGAAVPCWGLVDTADVLPEVPDGFARAWWPEPPVAQREGWQLDDRQLLGEVGRAQQSLAMAQGHWLMLLAEAERRQASVQVESMPTSSWLAAGASHSARAARRTCGSPPNWPGVPRWRPRSGWVGCPGSRPKPS